MLNVKTTAASGKAIPMMSGRYCCERSQSPPSAARNRPILPRSSISALSCHRFHKTTAYRRPCLRLCLPGLDESALAPSRLSFRGQSKATVASSSELRVSGCTLGTEAAPRWLPLTALPLHLDSPLLHASL